MRYLVMECRLGYAVVLDNEGRFRKVVNLGYEVGQKVDRIIEFDENGTERKKRVLRKQLMSLAAAACFCLVLFGAYRSYMLPYGTVQMQINPDVLISVNKMDHVVGIEGKNADGEALIEDYSYRWKKIDKVSDELADRAMEMGFLEEGGEIVLTVESEHDGWKTAVEEMLISELKIHLDDKVEIRTTVKKTDEHTIIIQPGAGEQENDSTGQPEVQNEDSDDLDDEADDSWDDASDDDWDDAADDDWDDASDDDWDDASDDDGDDDGGDWESDDGDD